MTVRSVIFDVIGHDNASKAFLSAAASSEKAATRMQGSMKRMQVASAALTKAVTVPVVALAAVAVKQASDFQKAQTLLQTAGGETADKMAAIGAGIKKIAVDTGTSLGQLNAGMYTVAKFGSKFSAVDQLNILKAAAEGAKAENVDLGTAVGALTTIMQSYNIPASKAIATQNELVRASGLAKTSMTDFASSLSSVVPLASALHISQAEVLGAIATMTQHGETAQQSAENLNNLITALAGQNQVASSAMQQLGINTLELQKNLGRNGLTGTLAIVNKAIADHTHNGMVVISVYKAAALASASLRQALGGMTGGLETNSASLLKGSMSIKDYQKYAKSLGGEAGAAGLQFLALYKSSLGFSNQLKAGQSTVSTSVTQFQKMLGGVTGMGAALKLGGASAKTFASSVQQIGDAAKKNGSDLETWAKTQGTLAVKTDKAKAKLQVLAVNLGTQLLPIATQILGVFSKIADWFSTLSKGTQGWIIKIVLLGAALGPVIGLVTRLGKAVIFLGTSMAATGRFVAGLRATELSIASMGTASYASGLKVGAFLSEFGPGIGLMAGVTLGAYALGRGINDLITKAPVASKAFRDLTADTNAWKAALNRTAGAVTATVTAGVALSLQQNGLAAQALKAHISLTTLTGGVTGTDAQFKKLIETWKQSGTISKSTELALLMMHTNFVQAAAGAKTFAEQQKAAAAAAAELADKTAAAHGDVSVLSASFDQANRALSKATAVKDFTNSLHTLRYQTSSASDAFKGLFQRAIDVADAMRRQGASNVDVARTLINNIQIIETMAGKYGLTQNAVAGLIKTMGLTPSQIDTYFNIDIAQALTKIAALRAALATVDPGAGGSSAVEAARIRAQIAAANASVSAALGSVSGKSSTSGTNQGKIGAGTGTGGGSTAAAAAKFAPSTLKAFLKSLTGTVADVNSAFQAILASAGSRLSSPLVKYLKADNARLDGEVAKRNAISVKLAAAQTKLKDILTAYATEKSTVAGAVSGTFDIATVQSQYTDQPTSIKTIIASIQTAVQNASRFSAAIKGLIGKHVPKGLIQQLLAAGPAALPQALALLNASAADMNAVTGAYTKLTATGQDLGTLAAQDFYGAGIKSAQGLVKGLESQQSLITKAITKLADAMVAAIKKALKIHSPSQVMHELGVFTGLGYLNGLTSQIPAVHKTTAHMVNGPTPRGQHAAWGGYTDNRKYDITVTGVEDPVAAAHAMIRHTQMASRG